MLASLLETEILIGILFGALIFITFFAKNIIKNLKVRGFINYTVIGSTLILFYNKFHIMDNALIADIVSVFIILISYFVDTWKRGKKTKKEKIALTVREQLTSDRMIALESGQTDIKMILRSMAAETDFRKTLRDKIRVSCDNYVNVNDALDDCYKEIIMEYGKITETISLRWYNSTYRGEENMDEMQDFLRNDIQRNLKKTENMMNDSIKKVKVLVSQREKGHLFSEYINLKENRFYTEFELLILRLSENGFKNESDIIKAFEHFLKRLFKKFSGLIKDWSKLQPKTFSDAL